MKKGLKWLAVMIAVASVFGCKGNKANAQEAEQEAFDDHMLENIQQVEGIVLFDGDTSQKTIETRISASVKQAAEKYIDYMMDEYPEQMGDGMFPVVDTQLTGGNKGNYKGNVRITYMRMYPTGKPYTASYSQADVEVTVDRGFFDWHIVR